MKVAVVGAGIAGLACALELQKAGIAVEVFEKSRGFGGRMSTRWVGDISNQTGFDHGAQYFVAEHPAFLEAVDTAVEQGGLRAWEGSVVDLSYGSVQVREAVVPRWVGVPGMTSFAKSLATPLSVQLQTRVESLAIQGDARLAINTVATSGARAHLPGFDAVAVAIPAEQAAVLLSPCDPQMAGLAASIESNPNWTVMVEFAEPLTIPFDGAFVHDCPLGWIARDSSKPARAAGERWVLQATSSWSLSHLEDEAGLVAVKLVDIFLSILGLKLTPVSATAHRWRYSTPSNSLGQEFLWNAQQKIGACGDWVKGPRVEAAYLSGWALGKKIAVALSHVK